MSTPRDTEGDLMPARVLMARYLSRNLGDGPRPPWMGPSVSVEDARRSPARRRQRDLELARWCGLDEGETEAFLRRVGLYDLREQAREEEEAVERLRVAKGERERLEGEAA